MHGKKIKKKAGYEVYCDSYARNPGLLKRLYFSNFFFRESVNLLLPFLDDNIKEAYVIIRPILMIPFIRYLFYKLKLKKLGKNCMLKFPVYIYNGRNIQIGSNVGLGAGTLLMASSKSSVKIGDNTLLSPNVFISTVTHRIDKERSIIIEEGTWIGRNVVIQPGVKIGKGSIISANSMVKDNTTIPPNTVFSGNPAKKIRNLTPL